MGSLGAARESRAASVARRQVRVAHAKSKEARNRMGEVVRVDAAGLP